MFKALRHTILAACLFFAQSAMAAAPAFDNATLTGKLIVGYQGWFACPDDALSHHNWVHWFSKNKPDAAHLRVDLLPDMSELPADERCATDLKTPGRTPITLYSAQNPATVERHFAWMAQYDIAGAALQRFVVGLDPRTPWVTTLIDHVLSNVRQAAEHNRRVFFVMYDIAGADPANWADLLAADWQRQLAAGLADSPAYLHDHGKPVIAIAGIGSKTRPGTAAQAAALIVKLRAIAAAHGGITLMAVTPTNWRTLDGDSNTDPAWRQIYLSFDVIAPWSVGRFGNPNDYAVFLRNRLKPDLAYATQNKIGYMPIIFPGFSWKNAMAQTGKSSLLNIIPRNRGQFLWMQANAAVDAGATMLYGAMFDEVDEGTALFKLAATEATLPAAPTTTLTLDADGTKLPSDWYLRVCRSISGLLRRRVASSTALPLPLPAQ